jgi:hypothetical protein
MKHFVRTALIASALVLTTALIGCASTDSSNRVGLYHSQDGTDYSSLPNAGAEWMAGHPGGQL